MAVKRKRKRDYRAEYKRRIERALKKGYSRSVARGHPKTKTKTIVVKGEKRRHRTVVEVGLRAAAFLGIRAGGDFQALVAADAKHVFGEVVKRRHGDDDAPRYQLRLEELQRRGGLFNWTNEAAFIAQMQAAGLTERDAYSTWYGSPK